MFSKCICHVVVFLFFRSCFSMVSSLWSKVPNVINLKDRSLKVFSKCICHCHCLCLCLWWDGPGLVKTIEKKPSMAMVPWEKNITIPSLQKMTIVEAKCQSFQECHRHRTPFAIHAMFFFYLQWCSDEAVFFLRWFFQVDARILWLERDLKQIAFKLNQIELKIKLTCFSTIIKLR